MILYSNGDSFVAGSGLALNLLPDCPGPYDTQTEENYRKYKKWMDQCRGDKRSFQIIEKLMPKAEKVASFPNKIKKLLGCELFNAAEGGSSFDRIARTTVVDLLSIKKNSNEKIVAIIGDTDIFRSEVAYCLKGVDTWYQVLLNMPGPSDMQGLIKYKALHEHYYQRMLEFYKNWILIKDFCRCNDIELHWISIGMIEENFSIIRNHNDLLALKNYVDLKHSVNMSSCAEGIQGKYVADGHFSEAVHDVVAKKFEKILEKYKK